MHFDDFRGKLDEQLSRMRRGQGRSVKTEERPRQFCRGWGRKLETEVRKRQQKFCLEEPRGEAIALRTTSLPIGIIIADHYPTVANAWTSDQWYLWLGVSVCEHALKWTNLVYTYSTPWQLLSMQWYRGYTVTQTGTVAWLLVNCATEAMCCCCWHGTARHKTA